MQFLFQVGQQVGVGLSVDLRAEDLLGTGDSQMGDLIAQSFHGALSSGASFGFGGFTGLGNDSGGFGARFIEKLAACFSAEARTSRSGLAGLAQFFDDLLLGMREITLRALSAAASPSAIFFARSSSAFTMRATRNFIVTHARMKNTTSWATRVAFRFTVFLHGQGWTGET